MIVCGGGNLLETDNVCDAVLSGQVIIFCMFASASNLNERTAKLDRSCSCIGNSVRATAFASGIGSAASLPLLLLLCGRAAGHSSHALGSRFFSLVGVSMTDLLGHAGLTRNCQTPVRSPLTTELLWKGP